MKEANIQSLLSKYFQENPPEQSMAYELKLCKSTSLPFSSVKEHQVQALQAVKGEGLHHKISDIPTSWVTGQMRFTSQKPFDGLFIKGNAYVVICFYIPRKQKAAYFIKVDDFIAMKKTITRKSITEEMARKACSFVVEL